MRVRTGTDHVALVGPYPFRALPGHGPDALLEAMDRLGIGDAWVGHLPTPWYRDAAAGNGELYAALAPFTARLRAVPTVNPAWPGWEREVATAVDTGAPALRAYPAHHGFPAAGPAMAALAGACASAAVELLLTVRFEDPRQRSRLDTAADLIGADVRAAVRAHPAVRVLVAGADRAVIEEVHWGLTAAESARVRWDISAVWGPPQDDLAHLFATIGVERFVFGTQFPLRLPEAALAKLELTG